MNHSSPIILACLTLGTALHAQQRQDPAAKNPRAVHAWLIELLDRDPARARKVYAAAAQNQENSAEDQRIARTRLRELDRVGRGTDLRQEFSRALAAPAGAERERKLQSLRNRICDPNLQRPIQPRPYMQETLRQLRADRSTTLARLNTEIARASAKGDREAWQRLRAQRFRLRRPAMPRERLDQVNRRPLAVIAQRHLQGNTRAADSMTRILRGRRFRGEIDLSTTPLPATAEHRELLSEARRRLAEFIDHADLSAFEQQVMENLAERLALLAGQRQESAATALLARIPYYGNLFLN